MTYTEILEMIIEERKYALDDIDVMETVSLAFEIPRTRVREIMYNMDKSEAA
jgi:hypothetical protein